MSETAQVEKQAIYQAYDAVNHLSTFIYFYRQALIKTSSIDEQKGFPEPELVAELLAHLVKHASEKIETVYEVT